MELLGRSNIGIDYNSEEKGKEKNLLRWIGTLPTPS